MSGRIVVHLDRGLGWTLPMVVACCGDCGTELARHRDHTTAIRAAGRRRCPACGTQTARRLPGTTSPATDLALAEASPATHTQARSTNGLTAAKEGCHPPHSPARVRVLAPSAHTQGAPS